MRVTAAAVLAGLAVASAVLVLGAVGASPSADERMAAFVRKTCMAGLKDPANVERIAEAADWPRFLDRSSPQESFMTVIGTWRASVDDGTVLVSVATSDNRGRPQNLCAIVFEEAKPNRAGFLAAVSAGWALDTVMDSSSSLRHEMYSVRNAQPGDLVLQMNSTQDGLVVSMTLLGTK